MSQNSCCVPGCSVTRQDGVTLHKLPDPKKHPEKFKTWISNIGGEVATLDCDTINNRRICERHFLDVHKYPKNRLSKIAVPVKHLPGDTCSSDSQTDSKDDQQTQTDSKDVGDSNAMSITDEQVQPIGETVSYVIAYESEQSKETTPTETILPSACNVLRTESYILIIEPDNIAQDEQQLIETQDEPLLIETKDEPQLIETKEELQLMETQDEQQLIETQDEPQLIETKDEPQLIETQDDSQLMETQDEPQLIETQDEQRLIETQDESQLMETQDWPQSDETQHEPQFIEISQSDIRGVDKYSVHKKEKMTNSKDPDSAIAQHKDYKALLKKLKKCEQEKKVWKTKYNMARKMSKTTAFNIVTKNMSDISKLFFQMQVAQSGRKKQGRRFTLEEKILALALYKQSTGSYHLLSKLCVLPCRRTLENLQLRILRSGNANT